MHDRDKARYKYPVDHTRYTSLMFSACLGWRGELGDMIETTMMEPREDGSEENRGHTHTHARTHTYIYIYQTRPYPHGCQGGQGPVYLSHSLNVSRRVPRRFGRKSPHTSRFTTWATSVSHANFSTRSGLGSRYREIPIYLYKSDLDLLCAGADHPDRCKYVRSMVYIPGNSLYGRDGAGMWSGAPATRLGRIRHGPRS